MRPRVSAVLLAFGCSAGMVLSACSSEGQHSTPSLTPGATDSARPSPTAEETPQPGVPRHSIVKQRDDLSHEHVRQWSNARELSGNRLRVDFTMGTPKCHGARAVVKERADTIDIAVMEGTLPDAPRNCTLETMLASVVVTLDEPVGERSLRHLESVVPGETADGSAA